jgi:general stress protein 26
MPEANEVAKLIELAKDIHITMFTTVDTEGHFVSRPMAQHLVEPDGDLWFFAERDSRVIEQLTADSHVGLTLTSSSTWISIDGTGEMVDDPGKKEELWNQWVEAWLPDGKTDPNVVLIRVDPHSAEYWDTPGGRVASLVSFVKAKATGEPYQGADQGRVEL